MGLNSTGTVTIYFSSKCKYSLTQFYLVTFVTRYITKNILLVYLINLSNTQQTTPHTVIRTYNLYL